MTSSMIKLWCNFGVSESETLSTSMIQEKRSENMQTLSFEEVSSTLDIENEKFIRPNAREIVRLFGLSYINIINSEKIAKNNRNMTIVYRKHKYDSRS